MVIAFEQFTTILTILVWFFTQNGGTPLQNAPSNNFRTSMWLTMR